MICRKILTLWLLLITIITSSQNVEFKKKNFDNKEGFDNAMVNLRKGDEIFNQGRKWLYADAVVFYLEANNFNPNNALLNFKIGICFLNSIDKAKSLEYFQKAQMLDPKVDAKIEFAVAQGYHYNMKWDEAILLYGKYRESVTDQGIQSEIDKRIFECESGKIITKTPVEVKIENMGNVINSKFNDGAPLVTKDEGMMVFTSRRKGTTGGELDIDVQEYYEDIYFSFKNGDTWTVPEQLSTALNTTSHDATVGLSLDGKTMFLYKGLINDGDLYVSNYTGNEWTTPKPLPTSVNTQYHESSACMSPDGATLFFVSNRADLSIGGGDIFVCKKNSQGDWADPQNIGTNINTVFDEENVYMNADGKTIYFCSKGHNSMGGHDVFRSTMLENGDWSEPVNMGYPFNTPDDELHVIAFGEIDAEYGYYTAIRPEGYGGKDIYRFDFVKEQMVEKNAETGDSSEVIYQDDINEPSSYFVDVDNTGDSSDNTGDDDAYTNKSGNNNDNNLPDDDQNNASNNNSTYQPDGDNKNADPGSAWKTTDMSTQGVTFNVQVGASRKQMPYKELHTRYRGSMNVTEIQHDGWYKYLIGTYSTYSDAKQIQKSCGVSDAWVVTNKNGVRINIKEVIGMLASLNPYLFYWYI